MLYVLQIEHIVKSHVTKDRTTSDRLFLSSGRTSYDDWIR